METIVLEKAYLTDIGRKRKQNEDYVDFFEPAEPDEVRRSGRIYVVADGVGGGAAGEVASEYATRKVLHQYFRSDDTDLGRRLRDVIREANRDLYQHVREHPELGRMGTTLVAAVVRGDELIIGNVGDSRAYLIRNGDIRQITRDHSLVAKLVEEGSITLEEAKQHPKRNVVLRSVGVDPETHPDIFEVRLLPGDQILLCSDGLTRYVSDEEMLGVAAENPADRAVKQLVNMANMRGGRDNISVMLLRAHEAGTALDHEDTSATMPMPARPELVGVDDTDPPRRRRQVRARRRNWILWVAPVGLFVVAAASVLVVLFVLLDLDLSDFISSSVTLEESPLPGVAESLPPAATVEQATRGSSNHEPVSSDIGSTVTPAPVLSPSLTPGIPGTEAPATPVGEISPTPAGSESPTNFTLPMRYVVPPGGTLWTIAATWWASKPSAQVSETWGCLSDANGRENPDQVDAGEALKVPGICMTDEGPVGVLDVLSIWNGTVERVVIANVGAETITPHPQHEDIHSRFAGSLRSAARDGSVVAYIETAEDGEVFGDLWLGTDDDPRRMKVVAAGCAAHPVWSPNENYLAFTSPCQFQDGTWIRNIDGDPGDIWVVPVPLDWEQADYSDFLLMLSGPGKEYVYNWLPAAADGE